MDWANTMATLIPGAEGVALRGLHQVTTPQTVTELHRRAGIGSRNAVRDALKRLAHQGVVLENRVGNVHEYRLNTEHVAYPAIDRALDAFEPYRLLRERLAQVVAQHFPRSGDSSPVSLAIYGSVARREASAISDVDLLLVFADEIDRDGPELLSLVESLHQLVPRWTGNPAHVFPISRGELLASARDGDPVSRSWDADADTVVGTDVRELMTRRAR